MDKVRPAQDPDKLGQSIKTVVKGAGISFTGIIIGNVLGIFNQALLARFLGVKDYGHLSLALSIVQVAIVLSILGLSEGSARYIPFFIERGELAEAKSTIRFSLRFVFTMSVVLGVIFFFFLGTIIRVFFHDQSIRPLLQILVITLPLSVLPILIISIIRAFKAVRYKALVFDIAAKILRIAIFIPFIFLGKALLGAIVAYLAAALLPIVHSLFFIRKKLLPQYSKLPVVPVGRKLLSFSWPLGLTGVSMFFETRADVLLLGYFLTAEDIGIYTPALVLTKMLTIVAVSFQFIFLPVVSEYSARGNSADLCLLYRTVTKWILALIVPVLSFILLFPKEIITFIYGQQYSGGWLALIFLAVGYSLGSVVSLAGNILVGAGHPKLNLASEVFAGLSSVLLNIVLIPIWGIAGAAIAAGFSFMLRGIAALALVYKTERFHPFALNQSKALLAGLIGFGTAYVSKFYLLKILPWQICLFLGGLIIMVVYGGSVLLLRSFDRNDRIVVESIESKLKINLTIFKKYM